jgi:hypothetical protein
MPFDRIGRCFVQLGAQFVKARIDLCFKRHAGFANGTVDLVVETVEARVKVFFIAGCHVASFWPV